MSTEKKSNHRTNVVRLGEPRVHTNADSLELFDIPNTAYQVVTKKGQFKAGDLGVYIQPDSVVPQTEPFRFIWENYMTEPEGQVPEKRRRITVRKFRGEWSEGLLLPVSDFGWKEESPYSSVPYAHEDQDVSETLGITHYAPPEENTKGDNERGPANKKKRYPKSLKGWFYFLLHKIGINLNGNVYGWDTEQGVQLPVYDVEALKNYKDAFEPNEEVIITEKIHGSNARYVFMNDKMYAGSRTLWKAPTSQCIWRKCLAANPWIEEWCRANEGVALYGEVTPTQGKFDYGSKEPQFFVFDIRRDSRWLSGEEVDEYLFHSPSLCGHWVPLMYRGPFSEFTEASVSGPSTVENAKHIREGVVIRPVVERHVRGLGRLQLKLVSNEFLEKETK